MKSTFLTTAALSLALIAPLSAQDAKPSPQSTAPAVKVETPKAPVAKVEPKVEAAKPGVSAAKTDAAKPAAAAKAQPKPAAPAKIVDLNTASQKELIALPKIGKVRSKAIIAGRPYKSVDDLVARKVLPKTVVEAIKDKIVVK